MNAAWSFAIARLVGLIVVAGIAGAIFGRPFVWIGVALAGYLCLQLSNLYRVERWLRLRNFTEPPEMGGAWSDVVAQVVRLHRRKRFHKQRILQLFRELRRSTAAMPDGVIVLNEINEIQWFNRTAGRLLLLKRKVDHGLRIDNLVRAPDFVRYLQEADHTDTLTLRWPLGGERYLSVQLIPYGAGQQLMLVRDVTRQTNLEAMRRDFVANASHELRSPLTVINGYLDALNDATSEPAPSEAQGGDIDPIWREPIAEMRRQAERMTAIINDLLELSKMESSGTEAGETPIDVAGMLSLLRKDVLAQTARPKDFVLKLDSAAKLLGDEAEIHSAFSNLVANAIKYTPAEGRVEVRWWSDTGGAHLTVTDTGIGIPAEHIPRLTERFYRVDPGRARQHGGSGLGLAIVKHALQRHGAWLEITSKEGEGSRFSCHFPRRRVLEGRQTGEALPPGRDTVSS